MFVPKLNFRTQLFCRPMCHYPGLIFSLNSLSYQTLSYQTLTASPSYSKHPQFVNLLAPRAEFGNHMGCFLTSSGKSSMCIFFFVALLPLLFRRRRRCVHCWSIYDIYGCCSHLGKRMENGGSPKCCDFWYPWRSILFQPWYWHLDLLPCRSNSRW